MILFVFTSHFLEESIVKYNIPIGVPIYRKRDNHDKKKLSYNGTIYVIYIGHIRMQS